MEGVRALLNIDNKSNSKDNDNENDNSDGNSGNHCDIPPTESPTGSPPSSSRGICAAPRTDTAANPGSGFDPDAGVTLQNQNLNDNEIIDTNAEDGEMVVAGTVAVREKTLHVNHDNSDGGNSSSNKSAMTLAVKKHGTENSEEEEEEEDGSDPWGEGAGESAWGKRSGLALIEALGSWCASVSAYDRLTHPTPDSAAGRAAEAETEWDDLEKRITRGGLDVQLMEFR